MRSYADTLTTTATDALNDLALLTRPALTVLDTQEITAVTAALAELTAALGQTLRQLTIYLPDENDHRRHTSPRDAHASLRAAGAAATHLAAALDTAHQTLGATAETITGGQNSTDEKGSDFNRR